MGTVLLQKKFQAGTSLLDHYNVVLRRFCTWKKIGPYQVLPTRKMGQVLVQDRQVQSHYGA